MCSYKSKGFVLTLVVAASLVLSACAAPTPQVVEKEKVVEKPVVQTVVVEKEKVVEKPVVQTVVVEKEKVVEKPVVQTVVVEKVITATPSPKSELATTLVIAEQEHPKSFDPMDTDDSTVNRITVLAYDALIQYKPGTTEIIPWLAKEWKISPDGLSYTFVLNQGVKFHDGTDLTASDVKFTFDRLKAINQGIAFELSDFDSARVVDDYTVELKLAKPSAPFLQVLPKIFIISEDGVKQNAKGDDWARTYLKDHDLGSGPYTLTSFTPEQQAIFTKFDGYWQGWQGKNIEKVIWRYVKEAATQRLMLEKGEIDIAMDPAKDDLPALSQNPDIQIIEGTTFVEYYVHMRTIHKPLDDVRVRKAIALAYDYDAHIKVALGGHGEQALGPYSRAIPWHDATLPKQTYDLAKAKELLTEAGYPNGGFTLKIAYLPVLDEEARTVEILDAGLQQLGIKLEPMGMTWPTMANLMQDETSAPDLYTVYAFPSAADPDSALRVNYHSTATKNGYNSSWYTNPQVDKLLDEGVATPDLAKREAIYKEVQRIITEDQPSIFVSNPTYVIAARSWVKGYVYNPAHHETVWVYGMTLEGKP